MRRLRIVFVVALFLNTCPLARAAVVEILPPGDQIKKERPRILLRAKGSKYAIGLDQLKALKRDADFAAGLKTLRSRKRAAAHAMAYLLSGEETDAEKALARLKAYNVKPVDAFDVWFGMFELALTYDWLYDHPKFTPELKKHVRDRAFILADQWGIKKGDDHVFHNYTWMNNCGLALWAMACWGDDPRAEALMKTARFRLNERMFPAMEHLNGLPGDAMGYWYSHCSWTAIVALMSMQSAYEIDAMTPIREKQGAWLDRQVEGMVQGTFPNMRFIPWGDMQQGPNGGVTHEIAGVTDAAIWALGSKQGAYFSRWLAEKRGMRRFYGETPIFYYLYSRHLKTEPAEPPLAMMVGGKFGGQAMMRSSWKDDATVVGFRCSDYYQCHFDYDVGSFVVYRNGVLAADSGYYTWGLYGPCSQTYAHNSLLLGGKGQRPVRGQWYKDMAHFNEGRADKRDGRRLEMGDIPFYKHAGKWTAVAGQFAQAYKPGIVKSCVRQLLYCRPNTVVVVDHLVPPDGKTLPEVKWLLQLPTKKLSTGKGFAASANEKSWLHCRSLTSQEEPVVEKSLVTQLGNNKRKLSKVSRANFVYKPAAEGLTLVHVIEVGDGKPVAPVAVNAKITADAVEVPLNGKTFVFSKKAPFAVEAK